MKKVNRHLFSIFLSFSFLLFGIINAFAENGLDTGNQTLSGDTTVTFQQSRSGIIPTGILPNNIFPIIIMMIITIVVMIVILKNKNKTAKSMLVALLAVGTLSSVNALSSFDVQAENLDTQTVASVTHIRANTPVSGITIAAEKYLIMDADANVPNATFTYTITAGSASPAATNNSTPIATGYTPTTGAASSYLIYIDYPIEAITNGAYVTSRRTGTGTGSRRLYTLTEGPAPIYSFHTHYQANNYYWHVSTAPFVTFETYNEDGSGERLNETTYDTPLEINGQIFYGSRINSSGGTDVQSNPNYQYNDFRPVTYTPYITFETVVKLVYFNSDFNAGSPATPTEIYSGGDTRKVSGGLPSVSPAIFTPNSTTYNTPEDMSTSTHLQMQAGKKDPVTLETGQKYARADIAINFSSVSFNEPGVYRYILTEDATSINGITTVSTTSHILDVWVESNDAGVLAISGYVLHETASSMDDNKADGFISSYATNNLTLANNVSGNQASGDRYFEYTVTLSGATAGTVYDINLDNADAQTIVTGANPTTHTNVSSITANSSGTVTASFWLQNRQSIAINGIAPSTTYRVVATDTTADGYAITYTIAES